MSYITLLLPTLVAARISINITCQFHTATPSIDFKFSGDEVNIITDEERIPFGITDDKLKHCTHKYLGKRPEDVFLHSPTPWEDLYRVYKWKQIVKTVTPRSGRVLNVTVEPQVVLQKYFGNKSQKPANYSIQLCTTVENRVFTSWNKSEVLAVNGDLHYVYLTEALDAGCQVDAVFTDLAKAFDKMYQNIKISELRRLTSVSFNSSWGQDKEQIEAVTVGSPSTWKILLEPGQVAKAVLTVNRGVIDLEVEYEASLSGAAAANYNPAFNGHHFWAPSISHVMQACNLSHSSLHHQLFTLDLYTTPYIQLVDLKSKQTIGEFFF